MTLGTAPNFENYVAGNAITAGSFTEIERYGVVASSPGSGVATTLAPVALGSIVIPANTFATTDLISLNGYFYVTTTTATADYENFVVSGGGTTGSGFTVGRDFSEAGDTISGTGVHMKADFMYVTSPETLVLQRKYSVASLGSYTTLYKTASNVGTWTPTGNFVIFAQCGSSGSTYMPMMWVERTRL